MHKDGQLYAPLLTYVAWWFHYSCQVYESTHAKCTLYNDSLYIFSFAEVETGQYTNIALEDYIYKLCSQKGQPEEHYICHCQAYSDIRERYHCFFTDGFEPLAEMVGALKRDIFHLSKELW